MEGRSRWRAGADGGQEPMEGRSRWRAGADGGQEPMEGGSRGSEQRVSSSGSVAALLAVAPLPLVLLAVAGHGRL
jgi:hypothetical protein